MDRWRWIPEPLGEIYVWLNIPEFMLHVVKDGKAIQSEKVVVGNSNSPDTGAYISDDKLLAESNEWNKTKVDNATKETNVKVKLDKPIPIHLTYFTAIVDDEGKVEVFDDIYELDQLDVKQEEAPVASPLAETAPPPSRKPVN